MNTRTLREAAESADAELFTGREAELAVVRDLLDPATPSRVLYVHGPGGIGKSALLREASRRASAAGFAVSTFDGGSLPIELDALIGRIAGGPNAFLVIDEAGALGSTLAPLRDALLDLLPDTARLVVADRAVPEPSWHEGALSAIVRDLPLRPLPDEDASALLASTGVEAGRREAILKWARGYPLALTVAATVPGTPDHRVDTELEERLTAWLGGRAILDVDPEVLDAAALVRVVDTRLLAAALPGRSAREAMRALGALPVVQRLGHRLSLHPVLAAAIRARLATMAPEHMRRLRRRMIQHLADRAVLGDVDAYFLMSEFIEDPALYSGMSAAPSATHYVDAPRPGELDGFAARWGFDRGPDWPELKPWLAGGVVVRRRDRSTVAVGRFAGLADVPGNGVVASAFRLAGQRGAADPGRAVVGVVCFAEIATPDFAEAIRLVNNSFIRRIDMTNPRWVFSHYPEPDRRPTEIIAAMGFAELGAGDRPVVGGDYGPGGVVRFLEGALLREQGARPPDRAAAELLAEDDDPVRQARLTKLLDETFGSDPEDRRLRLAIELVHCGPRRSEQECLDAMHVSRRTWYRLLRKARERVLAGPVGAETSDPGPAVGT